MDAPQERYILEWYDAAYIIAPGNLEMFTSLKDAQDSIRLDKVKWERTSDSIWWGRGSTGRYRIFRVTYPSHESIMYYLALREGQGLIDGDK